MSRFLAFTFGAVLALLGASYLIPGQTHTVDYQIITRDRIIIEEVMTTLDLEHIRDTTAVDPDLEEQLLAECVYAIARTAVEPMQGIIYYIEKYWSGDACAAYEHLQTHGWY
jgi:hypothetical protein